MVTKIGGWELREEPGAGPRMGRREVKRKAGRKVQERSGHATGEGEGWGGTGCVQAQAQGSGLGAGG